jgi:hypothetical protein
LTTTVFKNFPVVRCDTGTPSIFLEPSLLHRKSDFETFNVWEYSGRRKRFPFTIMELN